MIEVNTLSHTYPGTQRCAIDSIDFTIHDGEVFGFLGPSGAGKSTTQRALVGLLSGYRGSIKVDGRDVRAAGRGYYERIGVSFENPSLFGKLTARENLRFFATLYAKRCDDPDSLLRLVGLSDDGDTQAAHLSKGMKMRLDLARSLLHRPEILFLDEPTAGLDPVNARLVKEIIRTRRNEGATVFITTHNMTVADELCDRVAFIVDGRLTAIDSPRALKLRHGKKLVRVEFETAGGVHSREFPFEGIGRNRAFVDLLQNETVQTIHSLEATLEDVFVTVTGRRLDTESGVAP
ncbi:MAG: ABC transporter ATP-binding protein [Spirochaetota bacterium]